MKITAEEAQSILERVAYDIYNYELLWIDDVQEDYISLQGNQSTLYEELKNYKPQLHKLVKEYKKYFDTVWVGNIIV